MSDWNSIQNAESVFINSILLSLPELTNEVVTVVDVIETSTRRKLSMTETEIECGTIDFGRLLLTTQKSIVILVSIAVKKLDQDLQVDDICSSSKQSLLGATPNIFADMQQQNTLLQNSSLSDIEVLFSPCATYIVHSARPSSTPTAMPSCGTGSYEMGSGCGPCPAGYYSDVFNAMHCEPCPMNYYSTGGAEECVPCPGLTANIHPGSADCPAYSLKAPPYAYPVVAVMLALILVASLAKADYLNLPSMFVMSFFPFVDVVSDLSYLTYNTFYRESLLALCFVFLFAPTTFFAYSVFETKRAPPKPFGINYIWLWLDNHQPTFQNEPILENISKDNLTVNYLALLFLIPCQAIYLVFAVAFTVVWFVFGYFLYMCKVLSIGTY